MAFEQPTLREGDRGDEVTRLQSDLATVGCDPGLADGIFGPKTRSAVVTFQDAVLLDTDGIVGPLTWGVLEGPMTPVERSLSLADLPALTRALGHASDEGREYLSELGIGIER